MAERRSIPDKQGTGRAQTETEGTLGGKMRPEEAAATARSRQWYIQSPSISMGPGLRTV